MKAAYIYTKPTHKNKQKSNQYILEKKKNGKGGSSCHGAENIWMEPAYLGAQGYYSYHGWLPKGLGSKDLEDESGNGEFGGLARFGMHE